MKILKAIVTFVILIIFCIGLAAIGYLAYEHQDMKPIQIKAEKEVKTEGQKEQTEKEEALAKSQEQIIQVKKAMEEFDLRMVVATGTVEFDFTQIEKSNIFGKNSKQFRYVFDYDIGTVADSVEVLYDWEKGVPIIAVSKEKFKEFRVREASYNIIKRERSGVNELIGKEIDDKAFSANQKAAKMYAEQLVAKEKEEWYTGDFKEDNQFQMGHQHFKLELQKFLETKNLGPSQYEIQ